TRSPTLTSRAPAPKAAISPENSCPGMTGNGRGSPARVVQVGTHESSVWMTPAAWTRTRTSPSPGRGCGASSQVNASGPPRACSRMAFISHTHSASAAELDRDKPRTGAVANTLDVLRNGAVGSIDWLGLFGFGLHNEQQKCRSRRSEDRIVEGSFWT